MIILFHSIPENSPGTSVHSREECGIAVAWGDALCSQKKKKASLFIKTLVVVDAIK